MTSLMITFEARSFILLSMKSLTVLPLSKMFMSQFSGKILMTDPVEITLIITVKQLNYAMKIVVKTKIAGNRDIAFI